MTGAIWDVRRCFVGTGAADDVEALNRLLEAGWEPFAVTQSMNAPYVYHFRKPTLIDGSGAEGPRV